MKFLAITLTMAGLLLPAAAGMIIIRRRRHIIASRPADVPHACTPSPNQCAPSTTPYLTPTPTTIPRTYTGTPGGTYRPAGGHYTAPARPLTRSGPDLLPHRASAPMGLRAPYAPVQSRCRAEQRAQIKSPSRAWPAKGSDGFPMFAHP